MSRGRRYDKTVAIYRPSASRSASGAVTLPRPGSETATAKGKLFPGHGEVVYVGGAIHQADARLHIEASADLRPETGDTNASGQSDIVKIDSAYYRVLSVVDPGARGKFKVALLKFHA